MWQTPPPDLNLDPRAVHVWRISLEQPSESSDQFDSTLSKAEQTRAARLHFERDRLRYVISHHALRDILSRYLNKPPVKLKFVAGANGKPGIAGLQFNLAHTDDLALVAVCLKERVGVDVERVRADSDLMDLAGRYFSTVESTALRALPAKSRPLAFFNCWTRKEAYVKALGEGLSYPLQDFDVSLAPAEPARLLATRPDAAQASLWTLYDLDVGADYSAALAVEGNSHVLEFWSWQIQVPIK